MVVRLIIIAILLTSGSSMALQLIPDNHFQAGLDVYSPEGIEEGEIHWPTNSTVTPCWNLGQWFSHGSIYGCTPVSIAPGEGKWANIYKGVFMGTNADYGDIRLTVNSKAEYGYEYRDGTIKDWPHLLPGQKICSPGGGCLRRQTVCGFLS